MPRFLRWRVVGFAKQMKQKNAKKGGLRGFNLRARATPNIRLGGHGGGGLGGGGLSGVGLNAIKLPKPQRNPPTKANQAPPPKQQKQQKPPPQKKKKGNQSGSGGTTPPASSKG